MQLLPQCNNASSVYKAASGHSSALLCCLVEWCTVWTCSPPCLQVLARSASHLCVRGRTHHLLCFHALAELSTGHCNCVY